MVIWVYHQSVVGSEEGRDLTTALQGSGWGVVAEAGLEIGGKWRWSTAKSFKEFCSKGRAENWDGSWKALYCRESFFLLKREDNTACFHADGDNLAERVVLIL